MNTSSIKNTLSNIIFMTLCISLILTCHIYCIFIKIFVIIGLINQEQINTLKDKFKQMSDNMIEIHDYIALS